MSTKSSLKLKEHREALAANSDAFEFDIKQERPLPRLAYHLRNSGYRRAGHKAARPLLQEFMAALFDAQGRLPLFHVDGELPYCWNAPKQWHYNYIRYEWGHLRSRNQNEDAEDIRNLALLSARCNQHIQTSMDVSEVREWLTGSRVARRIEEVLARREVLMQSEHWSRLCARLSDFS